MHVYMFWRGFWQLFFTMIVIPYKVTMEGTFKVELPPKEAEFDGQPPTQIFCYPQKQFFLFPI